METTEEKRIGERKESEKKKIKMEGVTEEERSLEEAKH